ncbi:hypothetical protein PHMEG_00028885 [Phytophthora megakarya]|uniref:Uncharacterized protein n=1 Tax=Phytophthora megakarya TaxID=4795 RepID=A0A225V292_9STRA|nr:hypothetical protein PHMEG_00028885 [Phytophthora megakarya]
MSNPQPIFDVIRAPELPIWNHAALIEWLREWERYVEKMRHRCTTSGETYENVDAIVKGCVKHKTLKLDATYSSKFCSPPILKAQITRLIDLERRNCTSNDVVLFGLILEHAKVQQRFNGFRRILQQRQIRRRRSQDENPRRLGNVNAVAKLEPARSTPSTVQTFTPARTPRSSRPKPQDECLHCKGSHWLADCPTATAAVGEEAQRKYREAKERCASAVCSKVAKYTGSGRTVRINGLMENPDLLDTEQTRARCPKKKL